MLTTLDVRNIYTRCSAGFTARVHAVGDHWSDPTLLPGWDVRTLVNHLVSEERWTPELFGGATIGQVGDRFDGDLVGVDPVAAHDDAAAAALTAIRADGSVEGVVHLSFGDQPGREYALQLAADHLVHTWDLARAIGADDTLDPDAVTAIADWFAGTEDLYREMGVVGPRVDLRPGAGPQAHLLARFGRTS